MHAYVLLVRSAFNDKLFQLVLTSALSLDKYMLQAIHRTVSLLKKPSIHRGSIFLRKVYVGSIQKSIYMESVYIWEVYRKVYCRLATEQSLQKKSPIHKERIYEKCIYKVYIVGQPQDSLSGRSPLFIRKVYIKRIHKESVYGKCIYMRSIKESVCCRLATGQSLVEASYS